MKVVTVMLHGNFEKLIEKAKSKVTKVNISFGGCDKQSVPLYSLKHVAL